MKIEHPAHGEITALRQLWKEAFGDSDRYLDLFFSTAFSPNRCLCIRHNGDIAAAAYWMDCELSGQKAAYIYAVATLKAYRGRGLCRELMETIHTTLRAQGYCGSILVPGDAALRQMYSAMGYQDFGSMQSFSLPPADISAQMRKLSREEFAQLRRAFLPENAVLQEGAQLVLLDTLADFFQGDDFLLTVSRDDGRVLELLENRSFSGSQLIEQHPFAMFHSLKKGIFPTYFAFAFD